MKRGLSIDPKHRETMGMCVWLFMLIVDSADWETGIMYDWKDADIAGEMSLNPRTVRDWRQKLDKAGYISCIQKQHNLEIKIHNWNNPRDYSGTKLNKFQGDIPTQEENIQGDIQGDTQGGSENVTLPFNSKSISTDKKDLLENAGIDWKVLANFSDAEIAEHNEREQNYSEKTHEFERSMGYNPLPWDSPAFTRLKRFIPKQSIHDIQRFALWSKRDFSSFTPAKARQYPDQVIDLWPQACPPEDVSQVIPSEPERNYIPAPGFDNYLKGKKK